MGTMVTMKPRPQQYQSGTEFIHAWKKFAKGEEIPPPTNINGDPAMLWELYSEIQQAAAITIAQQNLGGTPTDNAIRSFLSDMHT